MTKLGLKYWSVHQGIWRVALFVMYPGVTSTRKENAIRKFLKSQGNLGQANLVLIGYASSEGSGKPAHPRSLARTSAARSSSSESRETFRQKARSLTSLNGWACAVKIRYDGMLEDTNSLDAPHFILLLDLFIIRVARCSYYGWFQSVKTFKYDLWYTAVNLILTTSMSYPYI